MKKKIGLIISVSIILIIASITFLSCDLVNRFRPSGVYTSDEYTNEEDGKTYRFLIKFEEEDATKDYCKGKVKYAYQYKVNGTSEWKTEELHILHPNLTYHIVFKENDINRINDPYGNHMAVKGFTDDQHARCSSSSSIYKVPLQKLMKNQREFFGYNITHIDYEFPTSKS